LLAVDVKIAVNDADSAGLRHRDRHPRFGDVSMADAIMGMLSGMARVTWRSGYRPRGQDIRQAGLSSTSSNVKASRIA